MRKKAGKCIDAVLETKYGNTYNIQQGPFFPSTVQIFTIGDSPGEVSEEPVTQEKQKKGWRLNCDVCEATEGLENEL